MLTKWKAVSFKGKQQICQPLAMQGWVCTAKSGTLGARHRVRITIEISQKTLEPFLDLCVSSLRRGHANLLCIVPILSDVRRQTCRNLPIYIP